MIYSKQLSSFLAVARTGSMLQAAKELYISQPALSQQMRLLEESLGFTLFERSNRGIVLTPAGERFAKDAQAIISLCEEAVSRGQAIAAKRGAALHIACRPDAYSALSSRVCPEFQRRFPQTPLMLVDIPMEEQLHAILEGRVDLGENYGSQLYESLGLGFCKLMEDREVCLVHPSNPLAGKPSISLFDLQGMELALQPEGKLAGPDRIRAFVRAHGLDIRIADTYDKNLFLQAVNGISPVIFTVPSILAKSFFPLAAIPLEWETPVDFGVVYRLDRANGVHKFLQTALECFKPGEKGI